MSSWLSYCQNFNFFYKKRAGFSVLVNSSVKYALLMKIKHYSVQETLLQDLVAKSARTNYYWSLNKNTSTSPEKKTKTGTLPALLSGALM